MSGYDRPARIHAAIASSLGLLGLAVCCGSAPSTPSIAEHHTIEITVKNGEVVDAPGPVEVSIGDHVELRVSTDVSDEVHVHGYDVLQAVGPGEPATISFVAAVPGQFEAELEEHHQTILELEVR